MKFPPPRSIILVLCCAAIFWPGTLIFAFPGVMRAYWQTTFQVGGPEIGRILFFILFPVGLFMFFIGRLIGRWSPGLLMGCGALLSAAATLLLPLATDFTHVYLWAFAVGSATAMTYLPGLTVVQHWFPARRGLVSGVFNMCFGASAALMAPVYSRLLTGWGYSTVAVLAAGSVMLFGLLPAGLIRLPARQRDQAGAASMHPADAPPLSMSVAASLKTRSFWMLWCTWAFAGAAGISMVTLSTAYGSARGLPASQAILLLTAFNVTNGLSRLVSGFVSDYIGRRLTLTLSFIAAGAAYLLMDRTASPALWLLYSAAIGYAFGTLFAVSAPLVGDCFGMEHFGAILGVVFTAYGFVAAPIGPWFCGYLLDAGGGDFSLIFSYLGALMLVAAVMIQLARPQVECILPVK